MVFLFLGSNQMVLLNVKKKNNKNLLLWVISNTINKPEGEESPRHSQDTFKI